MLLENNTFPQDTRVRKEAYALVREGYPVSVICPRSEGQRWREWMHGVFVCRFPKPPVPQGALGYLVEYGWSMAATVILTLEVFLRRGFDVIHAHNPPDTFVLLAILFRPLGKRFMFDHHDLCPELYSVRFSERPSATVSMILRFFESLSCRMADHVITTNESYRTVEMERCMVPAARITVVRNGPDADRLRPISKRQVSGGTPIQIGYLGVMGYQDGVHGLITALSILRKKGRNDFQALLVGGGDAFEDLRKLATRLGLSDQVEFIGEVPFDQVRAYYSRMDIAAAPEPSDDYNDRCTAIKITEYMAMGLPIVCFDLPEHRVTAGDCAVYAKPNDTVDFANGLEMLMDNSNLRYELGKRGRERIETKLAWSHQEKHLLLAYDILSGSTSANLKQTTAT
jgi:glycosyltransferase involved in cell wall biosynthesis